MTPAAACPSCGADAPAGARFCPTCGASLASAPPLATERKVVTTLFADIVGFTALGERFDPEDVDAALRGYFDMARTTIERFGGIVEKYIGDAVAGVFGVPIAHEDDAERAVRAALAIVDGVRSLPPVGEHELRVRIGVNTGRALARLSVNPGSGEGILVGDAVNTAARLLAAAPPMGVVVGEMTRRLTSQAIDYERMEARPAKGKSKPVERWLARGPIARRGAASEVALTPIVGREVELGVLSGLLDKAIAASQPQHVLIVGEAGIGKTRLLREFFRRADERPGFFCTWRQGHCPAYGDELAYSALSEIVSAHAGILQTDEPAIVEGKLTRALPESGDQWLRSRLRPLLGLAAPQAAREENFAAWLRFLEDIARKNPTVLVVEDIHWAAEPTLAFLGHVVRYATTVPLLVIATARPEFLEAHDALSSFRDKVTLVDLKALSLEESTRLARHLQPVAGLPVLADEVAERCGGNPLFAEELAWFLSERGLASSDAGPTEGEQATIRPEVIATLISARLDALQETQRNVLSDASVIGQIFWPGAVAAIGGMDPADVVAALDRLETREFVRRHSQSTHSGEAEYAFWHALTRDVAYEHLPRSSRARKHAAAADWIDAAGNALATEIPDMLAHHRYTALKLARSSRQEELATGLLVPAVDALSRAGARAMGLDVAAAERHFSRALELLPPDHTLRPRLLVRWANAIALGGDMRLALKTLSEAIDGLQAQGDNRTAAVALAESSNLLYRERMDEQGAADLAERALVLLESAGPCPELVRALEQGAYVSEASGNCAEAFERATRALDIADDLGLPVSARALMRCGIAQCDAGDEPGALDYLRTALSVAQQTGAAAEVSAAHACLGMTTLVFRGPREARAIYHDGSEIARGRHDILGQVSLKCMEAEALLFLGAWDETLRTCDELEDWLAGHEVSGELMAVQELRATVMALRGDERMEEAVRIVRDDDAVTLGTDKVAVTVAAVVLHAAGADQEARQHLEQLAGGTRSLGNQPIFALWLPLALRTARRAGSADLARRLFRAVPPAVTAIPHSSAAIDGLMHEADGDHEAALASFERAAAAWHCIEVSFEEAEARLGIGRCLAALGRSVGAVAALAEAREILARLGAQPALAETEALLIGIARAAAGRTARSGNETTL